LTLGILSPSDESATIVGPDSRAILRFLTVTCVLVSVFPAVAAEPETSFHAHIYAKGEARLELFLEEKVAVSAVSSAFRGVLACEPGPITASWDDDSYTWRYSATCAGAFPRQGLARTGRVNLQPVFDSL